MCRAPQNIIYVVPTIAVPVIRALAIVLYLLFLCSVHHVGLTNTLTTPLSSESVHIYSCHGPLALWQAADWRDVHFVWRPRQLFPHAWSQAAVFFLAEFHLVRDEVRVLAKRQVEQEDG